MLILSYCSFSLKIENHNLLLTQNSCISIIPRELDCLECTRVSLVYLQCAHIVVRICRFNNITAMPEHVLATIVNVEQILVIGVLIIF